MNRSLLSKAKELPKKPGVYVFRDKSGKILYIGKAANLRARVSSYFLKSSNLGLKIQTMIEKIIKIDHNLCSNEVEALFLESELIKRYKPPFNTDWKDEKNYLYVKISKEKFSLLSLVRRPTDDKAIYFGPFTDAKSLRNTLKIIRKIFPYRSCRVLPNKVCLMYAIKKCPGPCEGRILKDEYKKIVQKIILFFKKGASSVISNLEREMKKASNNQDFENAARLRDMINDLQHIDEAKILGEDFLKEQREDRALVNLKKKLNLKDIPNRIESYDISNVFGKEATGSMVVFEKGIPKKKDYRKFKIRFKGGIDDYKMIQEIVRRRFGQYIKSKKATEQKSHRAKKPQSKKVKDSFANLPDLILIDGGKGQLNAAYEILKRFDLKISIVSLAKKEEKIFVPESRFSIILMKDSEEMFLIQRVRDEAHRFALTYHQKLQDKKLKKSSLDGISGIGPKRKKELMKYFGSVEKIRKAKLEELKKIIGKKVAKKIKEYL